MSMEEREANVAHKLDSTSHPDVHHPLPEHSTLADDSLLSRHRLDREQEHKHNHTVPQPGPSYCSYQPTHSLPAGHSQLTPFPSQAEGPWLHPSFASSWSGYPNSLPSCLSQKDYSSCSGDSCISRYKFLSLPGRHSTSMSSLEQPLSLRSNPPSANFGHHTLSPYSCPPQGAACCAQCPAEVFNREPVANKHWPQYHPAYGPYCKSAVSSDISSKCSVSCPTPHITHRSLLYEGYISNASLLLQIQVTAGFLEPDTHRCEFFKIIILPLTTCLINTAHLSCF